MKTITFSVDRDGVVHHKEVVSEQDALDAIKWLRKHNGHAPETVHILISAMEIAVRISK